MVNQVVKSPTDYLNVVTEQLTEQLSALSEATQLDKTAMANLTQANATLVTTNSELPAKLTQALTQITCLQKEVDVLRKASKKSPPRGQNDKENKTTDTKMHIVTPMAEPLMLRTPVQRAKTGIQHTWNGPHFIASAVAASKTALPTIIIDN